MEIEGFLLLKRETPEYLGTGKCAAVCTTPKEYCGIPGIRVVSALGGFSLGCFGQFLGWVFSAMVGGSFRSTWVSLFGLLR